ncbi:sulfotransferase [Colwelliaceae bacterium 6471]
MPTFINLKIRKDDSGVDKSIAESLALLDKAYSARRSQQTEFLAKQIINQAPSTTAAYLPLFEVLKMQQRFDELEHLSQQGILHHPNEGLYYYNHAIALRFLREPLKATDAMSQAVKLCPNNYQWLNLLGIMNKENGQITDAQLCFSLCIENAPHYIAPYWHRSDLSAKLSLNEQEYLTTLLNSDLGNINDKVYAAFTLYRHYQQRQGYGNAFHFLSRGAALKRAQLHYKHSDEILEHRSIAEVFNQQLFAKKKNIGKHTPNGDNPIFICGMPRSGTTLAEQIISAHPLVNGGDELLELANATQTVLTPSLAQLGFPRWAPKLSSKQWSDIGEQYLLMTNGINNKRFFTDKMPLNYKAIGIIRLALPDAKIVYCQRDPMDILWGCYKQLFGQGNNFTYDLSELTEMIIAHHQLMQHWCSLFPEHIFTLDYQTLVHKQVSTTEKLLKFLTLDWHEQCLEYHRNPRTVHTMSNAQIRQPLFSSNISQWRNYQEQLMPYYQRFMQAGVIKEG